MAKKQHVSRIDTALQTEIEKLKIELSEPSGELPTAISVNESVERLTTPPPAPKRTEKAAPTVAVAEKKKTKTQKSGIERGRDAKGELNRVGITALIDRDLLQEVKVYAIQKNVSMSDIINDALYKYLNK
jgi:hypothetical protein